MSMAIALSVRRIGRYLNFIPNLILLFFAAPFMIVSGCGLPSLQQHPDTIYNPGHIQASQVKYTGLVIDTRGKGVAASIMSRILLRIDSGYQVVYGRGVFDDEAARKYGVCAYKKTLNEAYRSTERIGAEPLTIRPVQAVGSKNQDVIVSREDADLIISAFKDTGFEKECRVIFVID